MSFFESIHIAWRTLGANRTRSFLTVLGIIIGVAAVVCMVAVGDGAGRKSPRDFARSAPISFMFRLARHSPVAPDWPPAQVTP